MAELKDIKLPTLDIYEPPDVSIKPADLDDLEPGNTECTNCTGSNKSCKSCNGVA